MSQPVSGDSFTRISAAGSVVVSNNNTVLKRVIIPGTYVGTVEFYDSTTVAGTAAANNIFTMGLPVTSIPQSFEVNANCRNGLVYAASGTPTVTVLWG